MKLNFGLLSLAFATHPCDDFKIDRGYRYQGRLLDGFELKRGQPECEEKCRQLESCMGWSIKYNNCFLKSEILKEIADEDFISGLKFKPDYEGNQYLINHCRQMLKERQCPSPPSCVMSNPCGHIGFKLDEFGCINSSCDCRDDEEIIINGDIMYKQLSK